MLYIFYYYVYIREVRKGQFGGRGRHQEAHGNIISFATTCWQLLLDLKAW